jgi:short-subunit dehydrogenase
MRNRNKSAQVVVITGASSGIGQCSALEFSKDGASLVLAGRDKEALEAVRNTLTTPGDAISVPCDVTDLGSVQNVCRTAVEHFGRIDVWLNNAVVGVYGDFEDVPLRVFRHVFETAFFGYVHGAAAALVQFRKQSSGVVINVASVLGTIGIPHMSSYVAAKHAVIGFSECLRQELSNTGIAVCTVIPAAIDTPFYDHAANFTGRRIHPLPPVYRPELVANAIVEVAAKPRKQIFVPRSAAVLPLLRALAPTVTEGISARLINRFQIGRERVATTPGNLYEPRHRPFRPARRSALKVTLLVAATAATASMLVFGGRKDRLRKTA